MKKRVDAGSDVAAIGAWDASGSDPALLEKFSTGHDDALAGDAAAGLLFFVRIGADWGGPIDVYVDEEPPAEVFKDLKQVGREFLLAVATGRLVIDGIEFYRTRKANGTASDNALEIPAANYGLRFYESKAESGIDAPRQKDLAKIVGAKDSKFFELVQWLVIASYVVVPLLFFAVKHFYGWKMALLVSVAMTASAWGVISMMASGGRFKRAAKAHRELWQRAQEQQNPVFVFALRKIKDGEQVTGGWVDLRK